MKTCLKAVICFLVVLVFCTCYAQQASAATMMLPGDLRTIEEEAFAGDTSLDEVVVPEGVQRIRSRAFADSSLKAISLPSTLRSLADDAFDGTSLSQVNAEWNTLGANWAITNGVKLATSAPSSFSSEETILSAGNTKAENGTDVTAYLGKCFTVQDVTGGWFKFTAPVAGSYTFSVRAPSITETFYIRIYANRTGTISEIQKFKFEQSDEVVSYTLDNVSEGEIIYWWDARSSNMGWTFKESFDLMVAPVEYISKVEVKTAVITGTVIDAITGQGIAGVTVSVVDIEDTADEQSLLMGTDSIGIGASAALGAVYSTVTDQYGYYSLLAPIGLQLLHFELPGYISYDQEVNVSSDGGDVPQAILSKELTGDQYRVVLKWGNTPADLDSHLINENFHVYYSQKTTSVSDAMLDLDDTDGVGPETVTFTAESNQTYSYYVKDYTNRDSTSSSALGASGATVMIYHGNSVTEKHVPKGVGIYWHVFDLVNGRIQYVDTIGNTEPMASGTALSSVVVSATPESQTVGNSGASPFKYTISWTDNIESLHVYIEGMNFIEEWSKENGGTASDSYADGKGGIGDEALAQKMKQYTFYPVSGTMPNDYVVQIWAEDESGRETNRWSGKLTVANIVYTQGKSRKKEVDGIKVNCDIYAVSGTRYFPSEAEKYGIIDFSNGEPPYSLNTQTISAIEEIRDNLYGNERQGWVTALWGEYYLTSYSDVGFSGFRDDTSWSTWGLHEGVDLQYTTGTKTPEIYSLTDGKVVMDGKNSLGIIAVEKGEYWIIYMHCDSCEVNKNDSVKKGECIGKQGDKGANGAYHVHLSVWPKAWNGNTGIALDKGNDTNDTFNGNNGYSGLGKDIYSILYDLMN